MKENEIKYLETKSGERFPFIFSLNVMSAIQKKYGSMNSWEKLMKPESKENEADIEALLFFFTESINEGIDIENEKLDNKRPFVTSKKVGRIISEIGIENARNQLKSSVIDSSLNNNSNENKENDEKEKNQVTTQNQ